MPKHLFCHFQKYLERQCTQEGALMQPKKSANMRTYRWFMRGLQYVFASQISVTLQIHWPCPIFLDASFGSSSYVLTRKLTIVYKFS